MSMQPIIIHFRDIRFTVKVIPGEYHAEFAIYDIEGEEFDGSPLWHRAGAQTYPDSVSLLEQAEPFIHGNVKWDHCSNWNFDESERGCIHGCEREDLTRIGEVLARCWDLAKIHSVNWSD